MIFAVMGTIDITYVPCKENGIGSFVRPLQKTTHNDNSGHHFAKGYIAV